MSNCIEYTRKNNDAGYGIVEHKKYGTVMAHRIAYIEAHGPLSEDKPYVLHTCDNPPCVNLEHLWAGTKADNNLDCRRKGRHGTNKYEDRDSCINGHEFTFENTRAVSGARYCRVCQRNNSKVYQDKKREQRNERKREMRRLGLWT